MGFAFKEGERVLAQGKIGTVVKVVYVRPDDQGHIQIQYRVKKDDGAELVLPGKQLILVTKETETENFIVELTIEVPVGTTTADAVLDAVSEATSKISAEDLHVTAAAAWRMFEEPPEDSNAGQWGAQNLDDNPEPF